MSGIRPRHVLAVVVTIAVGPTSFAADSGPHPRVKELRILDQLAGSWTGTQPGSRRRTKTESEWILDGRVLQTTSRLSDGNELLILRSYDTSMRKFVVSVWDARGMAVIVPGTWSAAERTLTATTQAGDSTVSFVSQMTDDDTEKWQIQFTDARGKLLRNLSGTNRRSKP